MSPHRGERGRGQAVERKVDEPNLSQTTQSRQAKWQSRNPKARWAHMALASALKRGLIEREPCKVCGARGTDGHHPDYDRPMYVIWLCRRHHIAEHQRLAKLDNSPSLGAPKCAS